jgi:hypothetical protein
MRATGFLYFTASGQSPDGLHGQQDGLCEENLAQQAFISFCVEGEPPGAGA